MKGPGIIISFLIDNAYYTIIILSSNVYSVFTVDTDGVHGRRRRQSYPQQGQGLAVSPPGGQSQTTPVHHGCLCGLPRGSGQRWSSAAAGV